jgi:mRNA-degrading endonuclease RelE of RelBE toxin-antitoxin system
VTYRLVYEPGAEQLASRLPPDVKPLVKRAVERLRSNPYLGKELRFELAGYRSLRSRRYRVIYRVRDPERVVEVHYFGQRREVYETFRDMLSKR